jgi:hypothetical protein
VGQRCRPDGNSAARPLWQLAAQRRMQSSCCVVCHASSICCLTPCASMETQRHGGAAGPQHSSHPVAGNSSEVTNVPVSTVHPTDSKHRRNAPRPLWAVVMCLHNTMALISTCCTVCVGRSSAIWPFHWATTATRQTLTTRHWEAPTTLPPPTACNNGPIHFRQAMAPGVRAVVSVTHPNHHAHRCAVWYAIFSAVSRGAMTQLCS